MEGLRGGEYNLDGPGCQMDASISKSCRMADLAALDLQVHFSKGHGAYTSLKMIRYNNELRAVEEGKL
jgi:hypothetical protein